MDSTVCQHTIQNACQDQVLPYPLFNPLTIFNIHNNNHFTTLITNNHTYYYYDSLNLRLPPAINKIHNTLRQKYTRIEVAPPLLRQDTPNTHIQSTSQQTNGRTCGLHMIFINLSTIYQGRIPTLRLRLGIAYRLYRYRYRYRYRFHRLYRYNRYVDLEIPI